MTDPVTPGTFEVKEAHEDWLALVNVWYHTGRPVRQRMIIGRDEIDAAILALQEAKTRYPRVDVTKSVDTP